MQSINYEKADHPGRSLALEIGNYDIQLPSPTSVDPDSYPTELSTIEESVDARIKGYEHITVAKYGELAAQKNHWNSQGRPDMNPDPNKEIDTYQQVNVCDVDDANRVVQEHVQKSFSYRQGFIGTCEASSKC